MESHHFVGSEDEEADALDLRTNLFQEGDDGKGPSTSPSTSPINRRSGPITIAMAKKIQEDWNTTTDGRETSHYMFKDAITLV